MGIQHESGHTAIDLRPDRIGGLPAIDGYVLRLPVSYSLGAWREEFGSPPSVFNNFEARVELNQSRLRIGRLEPEIPIVISAHQYNQRGCLPFEVHLPTSTVECIEEIRAGGDIELLMHISCERLDTRHSVQHDDVLFRVDQSQWTDVLSQMNYGTYLLCELPIPHGGDEQLRSVWQMMQNARELLYTGHYSSAVLECRKSFEAVTKRFNVDFTEANKKFKGTRDDRLAMTKQERIHSLYSAANHAAQLSAHPDVDSGKVDYSRSEALLIYTVVASAISRFG